MIKVMFFCQGNICRSPMEEFVFKDMVKKKGVSNQFVIESSATSREEIGNPVHRGTRKKLHEVGISADGKTAVQLRKSDYYKYDYILGMDSWNMRNIRYIFDSDEEGKVYRLLDFSDKPRDIADPWYTGDFDKAYNDIERSCKALIDKLKTTHHFN